MASDTTTHDRTLAPTDYANLRDYYVGLTLTAANAGLKPNETPRPDDLAEAAREKLAADGVLADSETLALVLRHGDSTADYHGQPATDRALTALTADVTKAAADAMA